MNRQVGSLQSSNTVAPPARSWFRSAAGRLYFSRLAAIIVLKLVLLVGLYYAFLKPAVRPDASPAAIQHLLLDPTPAANPAPSPNR